MYKHDVSVHEIKIGSFCPSSISIISHDHVGNPKKNETLVRRIKICKIESPTEDDQNFKFSGFPNFPMFIFIPWPHKRWRNHCSFQPVYHNPLPSPRQKPPMPPRTKTLWRRPWPCQVGEPRFNSTAYEILREMDGICPGVYELYKCST